MARFISEISASVRASKRSVRYGFVFDARTRPQPRPGKMTRAPSMSMVSYRCFSCRVTSSTTRNFSPSGQGALSSGVARRGGGQLDDLAGGEDAVVDAIVVLGEEHVAAHLAAEQDLVVPHLALEVRMAGLPHDGHAAVLADVVDQGLRRL